jgi:hypothetical protein
LMKARPWLYWSCVMLFHRKMVKNRRETRGGRYECILELIHNLFQRGPFDEQDVN